MRHVSDALAAAIEARERTVRLRLDVDWDGDGHATMQADGKPLDDLSGKAATFSRQHTLVGQLPDEVRIVEGSAAAEFAVDLVKGETDDERLDAVRYFSRFNPDSPLYGRERMMRDVQADVEFLTADGWQPVPRMRGLVQAMPVSAGERTAALHALDYRQKLRKKIMLPVVPASTPRDEANPTDTTASPGLESTWVASYALAQCGVYASPPPRPGCRLWAPMHGSAAPFVADTVSGFNACDVEDVATFTQHRAVTFQPGPYLLGTETVPAGESMWLQYVSTHNQPAYRLIRADGHANCRFELWAKLTSNNSGGDWLTFSCITPDNTPSVTFYVSLAGQLTLTFDDLANSRTVNGPTFTAFAGGWHFFGGYLDTATGQAVFRIDDVTTAVSFAAITPFRPWTPADEFYYCNVAPVREGTAVAEVHLSAGGSAGDPWLNQMPFTPGAKIDRMQNKLTGLARTDSQEAWELLAELTAAEYGTVYADEDGVVQVASLGRLVSEQAQTVQRTVTSRTAIIDLAYDDTAFMIRNVVTCPYQPVDRHPNEVVWSSTDKVLIDAGRSVQVVAELAGPTVTPLSVDLAANTKADGTGTVVANGSADNLVEDVETRVGLSNITVRIDHRTSAGAPVTITVTNRSVNAVYLVDTNGARFRLRASYLKAGTAGAATWRHEASIAEFGEQPLDMASNTWRQDRRFALGIAMIACRDLAVPQQPLTNLEIVADPRLQVYDRIRVDDDTGTQLDGDYWVTGAREQLGAGYVMQLTGRPARDRHLVGVTPVGEGLVGIHGS